MGSHASIRGIPGDNIPEFLWKYMSGSQEDTPGLKRNHQKKFNLKNLS
jgi:hypothetical protein